MTAADRMRALHERKKAQGLRQVSVWVPAERVKELRQIAERMRTAQQMNNVDDCRAVLRLCREIQAELDGEKPFHSTDMQNALAEVWAILFPDNG